MGFRTLNAELRVLVSTLQRSGHRSPQFPLGLALAPNPFRTRTMRRNFQNWKASTKSSFDRFCESGERTFVAGISEVDPPKSIPISIKEEDVCFSDYSQFFFPEDLEHLGGFSNQKRFSDFVKSNPVPHKRGQCSVNTKSTPASWEDDFEVNCHGNPPRTFPTPIFAAFHHWMTSTGYLAVTALTTISLNEDCFRAGLFTAEQWWEVGRKTRRKLAQRQRLLESIVRVDAYMESQNEKKTLEERLQHVLSTKIRTKCTTPDRWTKAVNLMRDARALKELLLMDKNKDVINLDALDRQEQRALEVLNGNFLYLIGTTDTIEPKLFDKNEFDEFMEQKFGSIDEPSSSFIPVGEAQTIFSQYLARKVWCLQPWKKFQTASESFFKRVTTPIGAPVDKRALNIASRVLELLLQGDPTEAQSFEPAPESACLERSRLEGGKRFAMLSGFRPIKSYVKPVSIYTGGKIRTITKDSAAYVKYNWINKFLGSQFRKLKCSVFGGDVREWWDKIGGLEKTEEEFFCSGDLESATDLFDGRDRKSVV